MLDIKFVRENPDLVKENIKKKFQDQKLGLVDEVINLDKKYRELQLSGDTLRMERNSLSKEIGNLMREGKKDEAESTKAKVNEINSKLENIEKDTDEYSVKIKEQLIKVHGVFSYIGFEPCNNYLNALNLKQDNGYVVTNNGVTNIDGLFACGDIIKKEVYQISTAVSEGAICGLKAGKYVRSVNK